MRKNEGYDCKLASKLQTSPECVDFVDSYIRLQNDFSHDGLGDQIDNSYEAVRSAAIQIGGHNSDKYIHVARKVMECIERRYLGMCYLDQCNGMEMIDKQIRIAFVDIN